MIKNKALEIKSKDNKTIYLDPDKYEYNSYKHGSIEVIVKDGICKFYAEEGLHLLFAIPMANLEYYRYTEKTCFNCIYNRFCDPSLKCYKDGDKNMQYWKPSTYFSMYN